MKRSFLAILFFMFLIFPGYSFGYIVFLEVDDTIELDLLSGFQFDVVGEDVNNLNLTVYYQGSSVDVDGVTKPGAVYNLAPGYPWSFDKTSSNGYLVWDNSYGLFPLIAGLVLSLESTPNPFTFDNFILSANSNPSGFYELPYIIAQSSFSTADGSIYKISAVPIPSALLLLGSGLVGLVAVRRKRG